MPRPAARRVCALLLAGVAVALVAAPRAADVPAPLAIGAEAPDFTLPGVDGKTYSLASFAKSPVLVVIFTAVHCPTAEVYEARMKQLVTDYQSRGVAFAVIQPNSAKALRLDEMGYTDLGDSLDDMKVRAEHRKFNFPFLYDGETQEISRKYGPAATPHVFVFDQQRRLRYQGRIDSNPREAYAKVPDARNAIDAVLAGGTVAVEKTPTVGCSVKWLDKATLHDAEQRAIEKEAVPLEKVDAAGIKALRKQRDGQDHPGELLGHVVRAVHGRVPGAADDLPDVPQAALRPGHGQHQLPGRGEGRPQVPRSRSTPRRATCCRRPWTRTS